MTVSAISQILGDQTAVGLTAFTYGGAVFALWAEAVDGGKVLCWQAHGSTVIMRTQKLYGVNHFAARIRGDGNLLVVYDDAAVPSAETRIRQVVINPLTGSEVAPPTVVCVGAHPSLLTLRGAPASQPVLFYRRVNGQVYLRRSLNDAASWRDEQPILNAKVRDTDHLVAVETDDGHASLLQVGDDARRLAEIGNVLRTRPMAACAFDETLGFFAAESTVRTGQITDNLQGRAVFDGAGNILATSRTRQGADDGAGDLLRYGITGVVPTLAASAVLAAGAAPGGEIVRAPLSPLGAGAVIYAAPGSEAIVDLAVFGGHAFFAGYAEVAGTGLAGWVNLTTLASGTFALGAGVTRVSAVAQGTVVTTGVIAFGYTDGGAEYVKIGVFADPPSGMVFSAAHKMPARVNALAVSLTSLTEGYVYVGLTNRLNVYRFDGVTKPLRLWRTYPSLSRGEIQRLVVVTNGNVVAAMGRGGVIVFGAEGEILAQRLPSTLAAAPWRAKTVYAPGDVVRPTDGSRYAPQRRYFTCTQGGTSGSTEPLWAPTGTVQDPTAAAVNWTETGALDTIITDVALYPKFGLLFAVGITGGPAATKGRVFMLDSAGLISDPPVTATPVFNVVQGVTTVSPVYLTMHSPTPNAEIRYTTDGSVPDLTSALYAAPVPFEVSGAFQVRAIAYAPNSRPSLRTRVDFTIDLPNLPPPEIAPIAEILLGPVDFYPSITNGVSGTTIRYTTDGSDPTLASPVFTPGSIHVTDRIQIKAKAWKALWDASPVATFDYTVVTPMVPRSIGDTLSHILIAAGAPYDLIPNVWEQQGVVPTVAYATVIGTKKAEGIGPFTDANWYKLRNSETGDDYLDAAGDFTVTMIIKGGVADDVVFCNGLFNTSGYYFQHYSSAVGRAAFVYGGTILSETGASILDGNVHVVSFGRTGGTLYLKVDNRAVRSIAAPGSHTIGTNRPARIGRYENAGYADDGTIYELRFLSTGLSSAQYDALHAAILA